MLDLVLTNKEDTAEWQIFDLLCKIANNMSTASIEARPKVKPSTKINMRRAVDYTNNNVWVKYHISDDVFTNLKKILECDIELEIRRFEFTISTGIITLDEDKPYSKRGLVEKNIFGWQIHLPMNDKGNSVDKEYFDVTNEYIRRYNESNTVLL